MKARILLCRDQVEDQEAEDLAAALAAVASEVAPEVAASEGAPEAADSAADLEVASEEVITVVPTDRTDRFIMAVGITDIITEVAVVLAVSLEYL